MNDRFKFRIYDLEQKHYLRVIQDETTGAEGFAAFYGKYNNICKPMSFFLCHDIDRWVIEQCTGLKDKNGNLIYEGYIVKCDRDFDPDGRVNLTKEVIFTDGSFTLANLDPKNRDFCYINRFHNIEIIGNIHEQAEQKDMK